MDEGCVLMRITGIILFSRSDTDHFQMRSVDSSDDCSTRPVVETTRTGAVNTANVFSLLS